jgi:hypothetical protein
MTLAMPPLANIDTVPPWAWGTGFAAAVMVALWAIAAGMNQLDEFFARRKDKPSGQDVRNEAHERFATKADLLRVETQIQDLRVGSDRTLVDLYNKVNAAALATERLASVSEIHARRIEAHEGEINVLPDRLIAQLSNLGVLKRPDRS